MIVLFWELIFMENEWYITRYNIIHVFDSQIQPYYIRLKPSLPSFLTYDTIDAKTDL